MGRCYGCGRSRTHVCQDCYDYAQNRISKLIYELDEVKGLIKERRVNRCHAEDLG